MKQYLFDLAEQKARNIQNGFQQIKNTLAKPQHSLSTYVEYVNSLKMCKNQKDNLIDEKKRLEEMNVVLRRYKSKEDTAFTIQQSTLQYKIESITQDIVEVETLLQEKEGEAALNKETNVEELDKKISEEKEKIVSHNEKLGSESLMTKNTPFKEALDELAKIKKKFDESVKRLG